MKKRTTIYIDHEVWRGFRKVCLDRGESAGDGVARLISMNRNVDIFQKKVVAHVKEKVKDDIIIPKISKSDEAMLSKKQFEINKLRESGYFRPVPKGGK